MLDNREALTEQIHDTAIKLGISNKSVEKDIYVTKLIHAMSQVDHEYYRLVFQGGTCLAKAHKIIPRMSEDCDFRIEKKPLAIDLSRTKARNELKDFRQTIKDCLIKTDFFVDDSKIRIRDEGRFVNVKLDYPTMYTQEVSALKPFLVIDFFLGDVKTPTIDLSVTTLIKNTFGNTIKHPEMNITCVSVVETAAEKLVGLTRRIATIQHRQYYNDPALVRHAYDLYKINEAGKLSGEFSSLVTKILGTEITKFESHNTEYAINPYQEMSRALKILESKEWRQNWDRFIADMVFEQSPPTYDQALHNLNNLHDKAIAAIKEQSKNFYVVNIAEKTNGKESHDKKIKEMVNTYIEKHAKMSELTVLKYNTLQSDPQAAKKYDQEAAILDKELTVIANKAFKDRDVKNELRKLGQEISKEPMKTCKFSELKEKSEKSQLTKNDIFKVLQHMENRTRDFSRSQELKQDNDISY